MGEIVGSTGRDPWQLLSLVYQVSALQAEEMLSSLDGQCI